MRLNRFFTERTNLTINSSVKLQDSDIKHIRNVLRLKKGNEIILFNGEKEYLAELNVVGREFVTAHIKKILKVADFSEESGVEITLFQSLLRSNKFDLVIEKTTELGIDNIVPIETEFSQIKRDVALKRLSRWKKVTIAASKQSERVKIPDISEPISFKEAINLKDKFDIVFFFTIPRDNIKESQTTMNLKEFFESNEEKYKKIAYIIGPEGGFSPNEHSLSKNSNLEFVSFGNTILRSETAAIAILSVFKYIFD